MQFKDLPDILPLYGVEKMILLPRVQLPLVAVNKVEQTALDVALSQKNRLLGIVQTKPEGGYFQRGCLGRIVGFQESLRPMAVVQGICRFHIDEIHDGNPSFARVNYQGYESDLDDMPLDLFVDRPRLLDCLKDYLSDQDIMANWDEIDHASDDLILNSITMACPFEPIEKQALLESYSLSERCDLIITLMEMAQNQSLGTIPTFH